MLVATAMAVAFASTAHAGEYKMLLCAGNNGSNSFDTATNTRSAQNPNGIFDFNNFCGPAPDPAGNNAFLRISENQTSGNAGDTAYGQISWSATPWVAIRGGGGYTREPDGLNDGWRGRFWAEDWGGGTNNILMQGTNSSNSGIFWSPTSTFAPHLWPFGGYGDYRRFVFELTCMRPAGCDRSGSNTVDANTIVLILDDASPVDLHLTHTEEPLLSSQWVRGTQTVYYSWSDQGSGIRKEWIDLDGSRPFNIDHNCDVGSSGPNGEFARAFQPCSTAANIGRSYAFDTASLADGAHTLQACAQDYGQWKGLDGTGGQSCDARTIHTDNTPPGAPLGLQVTSANPARYLDRFGARFALPPDPGSPIAGVRYFITDDGQGGKVVVPDKFAAGSEPTSLSGVEGPPKPSAYTLHVALQDQVGFLSPYATVPIPHDTTPPAAPQALRVSGPTDARRVPRFDLAWQNIVDSGSPIDAAHYQVIDQAGNVVAETRTVTAQNPEAISGIETPPARGDRVRLWLSDAEGNVGAPATVAVPRDTTPPAAPQDLFVAPPGSSRAEAGFDVRWRNIADEGSPIAAAHYEVLGADGTVLVGPRTLAEEGISSIADLEAATGRGQFGLKLWLSDAEGNVGAPVSAPLSYECVGSPMGEGRSIGVGFGERGLGSIRVPEGAGATLTGALRGGGDLSGAPVCVFARVLTESRREFLGLAMAGKGGSFRFEVAGGPSREFTVVNRAGQREASASATLRTRVRPTLELGRKVIRDGGFETFRGSIPPPDNDGVIVVLQVRDSGEHWRAFRRYRTRDGGRYSLRYRFSRTRRPTVYVVRAQVRGQDAYAYEEGNSPSRRFLVAP